jgi:hypothetical protein
VEGLAGPLGKMLCGVEEVSDELNSEVLNATVAELPVGTGSHMVDPPHH